MTAAELMRNQRQRPSQLLLGLTSTTAFSLGSVVQSIASSTSRHSTMCTSWHSRSTRGRSDSHGCSTTPLPRHQPRHASNTCPSGTNANATSGSTIEGVLGW